MQTHEVERGLPPVLLFFVSCLHKVRYALVNPGPRRVERRMRELMDCSEPGESRISLAKRRQHDAAALKGSSIAICEFQKLNFFTRLTEPFLDKRKGQIGGKGVILGCIPVVWQVVDLCSGPVQQIVVGNHKGGYNKNHRNVTAFRSGRFLDAVSSQGMRTLAATQDCRP